MDDITVAGRDTRSPMVDLVDHRVAVGAVLALVLASVCALTLGGNALVLIVGALLLGVVGLAAAAL